MSATPTKQTNLRPALSGLPEVVSPLVSVVLPCYCEEGNLCALKTEIEDVLRGLPVRWEIIFVDDGSRDATWSVVCSLSQADPRVHGIRLSRNFGHQLALLAGLQAARGDAVIMMDADHQHPAALLPLMIAEWLSGKKVVLTKRKDPPHVPLLKRLTSRVYYRVFSFLTGVNIQPGMADFRLLDRSSLVPILSLREGRPFLRALVHWVGFQHSVIEFSAADRRAGISAYNWRRMLSLAWSGITSFSVIPLRVSLVLGLVTSLLATVQLAETMYAKLVRGDAVPGWASLSGMLSLFFGILFVILGVLGEYLARILEDVRGRPRFIVQEQIGVQVQCLDGPRHTA